jgi:hypothetical protein
MRPPDNRSAPGANRGAGNLVTFGKWQGELDTKKPSLPQGVIFSAVPRGTRWATVAISPLGERVRMGVFHSRGDALAAARIMAGIVRARWLP